MSLSPCVTWERSDRWPPNVYTCRHTHYDMKCYNSHLITLWHTAICSYCTIRCQAWLRLISRGTVYRARKHKPVSSPLPSQPPFRFTILHHESYQSLPMHHLHHHHHTHCLYYLITTGTFRGYADFWVKRGDISGTRQRDRQGEIDQDRHRQKQKTDRRIIQKEWGEWVPNHDHVIYLTNLTPSHFIAEVFH